MNSIQKKNKLYLFTNTYPFGVDEVFVENEVRVLANYFEEIHIFPNKKEDVIRKHPGNIYVHFVSDKMKPRKTLSVLVANLFLVFKILKGDMLSNGLRTSLKYFKNNLSAIAGAIRTADHLSAIINRSSSVEKLFYSYWMNNRALTCAVMKYKQCIHRFIFRVHGYDLYDYLRPDKYIPFRKFNMEMCENVYTVCTAAQEYLKSQNIYPEKVQMSHLGVFDNGINPFILNEKFTLVSCSSLNIYKRVDKIIDVLKHISFPIKWIHFGGKGDGHSVEEFMEMCKELPLNVQYEFRGAVSNDVLMNFYKSTSVNLFIHLTFTEGGVPVVLQEAASFGIPMLSTKTGGVSEIVNGNTGILIEKEFEAKAVAKLISDFRNSEKNSEKFRKGVKLFWKENFYAENNFAKFYCEII